MIGYQQLLQIVLYGVEALTRIYTPLLGLMWNFAIRYGLQGNMSYLGFAMGNTSYLGLYSYLYGSIMPAMISLVLGISAMLIIAGSGNSPGTMHRNQVIRIFLSVTVAAGSMAIMSLLLSSLQVPFDILFDRGNVDWYSFYSVFSSGAVAGTGTRSSTVSVIARFLLLSAYFIAVTSLLAVLVFRQALMILFILIMPVLTILACLDVGVKYAKMAWELVLEFMFFPFAVMLSLMLARIFSADVALNLAFLFLPSVLPGYLMFSGRNLSTAPMMSFIGGMTLGGAASRTAGIATSFMDSASAGSPIRAMSSIALAPAADYRLVSGFRAAKMDRKPLLEDVKNEELSYRKGYQG
jgi:hypothetical protein